MTLTHSACQADVLLLNDGASPKQINTMGYLLCVLEKLKNGERSSLFSVPFSYAQTSGERT